MALNVQPHIFNTVPKHDVFGFYNDRGAIQYSAVADTLKFNKKDVSKAVRVDIKLVRYEKSSIPEEIKTFFASIAWLLQVSHQHLQDKDKVIKWLNAPNPVCGGFSPKAMIHMGQYQKLLKIVSSYAEGNIP